MAKGETIHVRALETGFDNLVLREPGDEFDMPKGSKAHWFEEIKPTKGGKAPDEQGDDSKDPA